MYSLNVSEACSQVKYIASLPNQQEPGVIVEFGNEVYIGNCYVPTLGTYDTSATTAWYTLNPIIVINNRPPIIRDVFI